MTALLSTGAWIAHDLGLAVGLGGTLFGQTALHPAMRGVSDERERGAVVRDAWQRFGWLQLGGLALAAATWFTGRSRLSGRALGRTAQPLVSVKDGLMIGALASALGANVAGRLMSRQGRDGALPLDREGDPAARAPERAHRLSRATSFFGVTNLVCAAAVLGITTALAMRAGRSARWGVVSRWLP